MTRQIILRRALYWVSAIAGLLFLSGCATVVKSPFERQSTSLDVSEKSVVMLSVNFRNAWRPKYQPTRQMVLHLERPQADSKDDRANLLVAEADFVQKSDSSTEVLFRGAIEPGAWRLTGISGISTRVLITGNFMIPFESQFDVAPQTVGYLGKVVAVVRRREEGEFRAGSPIPLLDQNVSGFGTGTFDVTIENDLNTVEPSLVSTYPVLADHEIRFIAGLDWDRTPFDKEDGSE